MPFKSEMQRRYMWANIPAIARAWEEEAKREKEREAKRKKDQSKHLAKLQGRTD